jgi:uncharacterized protein
MLPRQISDSILNLTSKFPILSISGPRQSGKTTLLKQIFPDYQYLNLEEPDLRDFANEDPRGFLRQYDKFVIFDEVQRVPKLFSYLQAKVDNDQIMGQFVLSGSQNFLLMEKITQSLAGRVALFKLMPFSHAELGDLRSEDVHETLFKGGYPVIFDRTIEPATYFQQYLETYLERDVRTLSVVKDLAQFRIFMRLAAGRVGQPLNVHSLATESGITVPTLKNWLSILEASFIIFQIQPYFENFNKRLTKSTKLYFADTGLLCNLLGIRAAEPLQTHPLRGSIFENMVIAELQKNRWNRGENAEFYFWKDSNGVEIDFLEILANKFNLFESKCSFTPNMDFFKGIKSFERISNKEIAQKMVIYANDESRNYSAGELVSWLRLKDL